MTQATLYVALTAACLAATAVGFVAERRRSERLWSLGRWTGRVCVGLALVTWLLRWAAAGHLPIFGTYESALSLALAVLFAALLADHSAKMPVVWPVSTGLAALLLGHGLAFDASVFPLTISERSWVVDIHAVLAWAAFACLAVNAAVALKLLRSASGGERLLTFTLSLGFALHTAMLASGSVYKFLLFGTPWSFDPIETLGFAAWVSYGTLLHLNRLAGWEARRLAPWCLSVFVLLTVSYRTIVHLPAWSTYHIFDMDLRMHVTPSNVPSAGGGR